jgi:hypothetical protein
MLAASEVQSLYQKIGRPSPQADQGTLVSNDFQDTLVSFEADRGRGLISVERYRGLKLSHGSAFSFAK